MKYVAPQRGVKAFTCPHCGVLSLQLWASNDQYLKQGRAYNSDQVIATAICGHCGKYSLWHQQTMVFPNRGDAPPPNPDMPADVRSDYEEAAAIASVSPKGAAALLRLAIQKLCKHLGGDGKNINADIGRLVQNGLPPKVQQSLDAVRVIGNNAVHPGQIEADDPEVAANLFMLLNVTTETMISVPKKVTEIYSALPGATLEAIEKRDGRDGP